MKRLFTMCIMIALVFVPSLITSCSTSFPSQATNTTTQYIGKINELLGRVPGDINVFSVDELKNNTVSTLQNISTLLTTSSSLINKYNNPETRTDISLTEVLSAMSAYETAKTDISNLRTTWNKVNSEVKSLNANDLRNAVNTLSFIDDALNIGQNSLNDNMQTIGNIISILRGN